MWQLALLVFGSFAAIDLGASAEIERFLDRLDENDDVQEVYHNAVLPEEDDE